MKVRSIFLIFLLAFFLGLAAFLGHTDTDSTEESETTQEVKTTEDSAESDTDQNEPKTNSEVRTKVNVYSQIIKGEDSDTDDLSKVIQELHKEIDRLSKKDLQSNKIELNQKVLSDTSRIVIDNKDVDKLAEEIKKLVQDEGVESENLTEKIKKLLNKHKAANVFLGLGDVKGIKIDPSGSAEIIIDPKKLKELESKIKELVENSDTVSDELAKLIKKLVEKKALDKNSMKFLEIIPRTSSRITIESDEISKLKKRVDQLEKKIDQLIQKLDRKNSQPSESEN